METDNKSCFSISNQTKQITNDLVDLIKTTLYILPQTNKIYFDYTVFKIYANDSNCDYIIDYIFELAAIIIQQYESFEMHINMFSFSISAFNRYQKIIEKVSLRVNEIDKLSKICIYYSPSFIDLISKIVRKFIKHPDISEKMIFFGKHDSEILIPNLFKNNVIL
jgi:hypothetical protein